MEHSSALQSSRHAGDDWDLRIEGADLVDLKESAHSHDEVTTNFVGFQYVSAVLDGGSAK